MAKIISRLININFSKLVSKHLVNSQKLQHKYTNSPNFCTGILFKRFAAKDDGSRENLLSVLTYPNAEVVENIDLPYFKDSLTLKIRGHSQGIVCLSDLECSGDILLCKPATREFYFLSRSSLLLYERPYDARDTRAVGFGYDSNSNDFKVVRIIWFNQWRNIYDQRVEVYNLSRNEWREIKTQVLGYVIWNSSFQICHNGVCYWLAVNHEDKTRFILSFDISKEVFHKIPLPESFRNRRDYKSMGVWNGSVVLFHCPWTIHENEKETKIDIWTMEKDDSFSKVFTIDHVSGLVKPLLFVNSDELVMETKDAHVISINVNTKEVKNLPVKGGCPWMIQSSPFDMSSQSVMIGGTRIFK